MFLSSDDLSILLTLSLIAVSCAVVGTFLLLNRLTLLGDAISHAVLPGLPLAYIITGSRNSFWMLIGALISGGFASGLISFLQRRTRISPDAALGLVFTTFFSVGVILINAVASKIDLDLDCVLYGAAEHIPFITDILFGYEAPRAFFLGLSAFILLTVFVTAFYKELILSAFDPGLAKTQGMLDSVLRACFLFIATFTIVISFEALGAITVVALLAAPAATGYLLSKRLSFVFLFSILSSLLAVWLGYLLALYFDTSTGGAVGTMSGALWLLALLFSPVHGLLKTYLTSSGAKLIIIKEDILGTLFRLSEDAQPRTAWMNKLKTRIPNQFLLYYSLFELWFSRELSLFSLSLTQKGLRHASSLVRVHRLFELYLSKNTVLPLDHLHAPSERMEHFIPADVKEELLREFPELRDPHGKVIPK